MSTKSKLAGMMNAAKSASKENSDNLGSRGGQIHRIRNIEVSKIYANPEQHRKYFDPDAQQKLKNAIEKNGFKGAILLRPLPENLSDQANKEHEYELVYGESRLRAVIALSWDIIPATIEDLSDEEVHRIRLDENLVRKDLNPIEEMEGLLEVAADELKVSKQQVLSLLDEVDNALKRNKKVTGDIARQSKQFTSVLDYYNKGSLSGFRTKYRKIQRLPDDIKKAVTESLDWSKAVEIAPIKDPNERSKVLSWAIANNPSIVQIRQKRKEIKAKAANGNHQGTGTEVKERLYKSLKRVKNSDVWENPEKVQKLKKLTAEFESIFGIKS